MSIVGTRPPLISETNLYEPHHNPKVLTQSEATVPIKMPNIIQP